LQIILYLGMAIMSHTTNAGFSGNRSTYIPFLGLLWAHKNCRQTVKCYRTRNLILLVGTECTRAIEWVIQNELPQLVPKWSWEFIAKMLVLLKWMTICIGCWNLNLFEYYRGCWSSRMWPHRQPQNPRICMKCHITSQMPNWNSTWCPFGDSRNEGLKCNVCGWAWGFKLGHGVPPHITDNACLAEWLRILFYPMHSPWGCQFNSRAATPFFFWPLCGWP
jgi:hypothetical protein